MSALLQKAANPAQDFHGEKSIFECLEDPHAAAPLPSLDCVLRQLDDLTRNSSLRIDEITRLVQVDQGLSLRVLRMANSVYYAPPQPILDVQEAILHVGLNTFRGAVVSARGIEQACLAKKETLDWREFWIHAAGVGHVTLELASHLRTSELGLESFYLMGLLHDVGKVVLAQLMPATFDKIYGQCRRENLAPAARELESLGIEHGHLGAWYLEKQGMPGALCEAVRFHHGPVDIEKSHGRHALVLQVADLFVRHQRLGRSGNEEPIGDPFGSAPWRTYTTLCQPGAVEGDAFKGGLVDRIEKISVLVRSLIA